MVILKVIAIFTVTFTATFCIVTVTSFLINRIKTIIKKHQLRNQTVTRKFGGRKKKEVRKTYNKATGVWEIEN